MSPLCDFSVSGTLAYTSFSWIQILNQNLLLIDYISEYTWTRGFILNTNIYIWNIKPGIRDFLFKHKHSFVRTYSYYYLVQGTFSKCIVMAPLYTNLKNSYTDTWYCAKVTINSETLKYKHWNNFWRKSDVQYKEPYLYTGEFGVIWHLSLGECSRWQL